ncbi:hypothetical protein NEMBOFW57_003153 [Staphylotrichum longicolle]|uniref:Uncharacterized protein n=1 Tax=Staphylotrichum longicolle TaxID=669026 RepID=A0AAD4F7B6_9PEZI|nr:hypothetical protein NEMBOFW57_003153 [Staphylotrichum longicolle]
MRTPKQKSRRGSRRSTQRFDGELVNNPFETGIHTQSRPPQRNDQHKPHKQAATASANGGPSDAYFDLPEGGIDNSTVYHPSGSSSFTTAVTAPAPAPAVAHVPPSNPESSSTDTAHTDDTPHHHHPAHHAPTFTGYRAPLTAYPQLDEATMQAHQQALNERQYAHQGAVTAWADHAGMGVRLVAPPPMGVPYCYTVDALIAAGRAGGGGDVDDDWCVVPRPTGPDGELAGTGTWTGEGAEEVGAVVSLVDGFVFA